MAHREIVTDGFCGGGGVSLGMERAGIRLGPDVAMNHDDDAISMHSMNHPWTHHYKKDIWEVNPYEATGGRPVGLSWWSPDCTHFSVARGSAPVQKNIRGLAWVKLRWAATVKPRVQILENVKEFQTWGPLLPNGQPDPSQRGRTFKSFVNALIRQGYAVEWRVLRACDYGAPTKRERFIMISRRDGKPIVWPEPTHGDPKSLAVQSGRLKPWKTAAEIINWSIPTKSIFNREKPLAENTMRRIALGTFKFLINDPDPFIAPVEADPEIDNSDLVTAFLSQYYTADVARGQRMDEPIMTIPTANRYALVTAYMTKFRGTNVGYGADEPMHTITSGGLHHGIVEAFLIAYYGSSIGQDLNDPINTIVSKDRFALVMVHGTPYKIVDIRMRMLQAEELYAGQGFDASYIINRGHDGRKFSKKVQVDKCGNSVPPDLAAAVIKANCPELCAGIQEWAM